MSNSASWHQRLSIRQRLLVAATFWIGGLILIAGVSIPILVYAYLVDNNKAQLNIIGDELIANLTLTKQGQLTLRRPISDLKFSLPYSGYYWTIGIDEQTLRSRSLWDKNFTQQKHSNTLLGAKGEPLISVQKEMTIPELRKPLIVTIGADENPIKQAVNSLIGLLVVILLLLFCGLMIFTMVQINWSLRPLNKLQAELKALENGECEALSDQFPIEIKPLITDLNALLFHYQELLFRARNHAGNLSHSLKTPLSIVKNQVDALPMAQKDELNEAVFKLQQQIDYHLGRARMAGSMNILSVSASPAQRVDAISRAFDKLYATRNVMLINEIDDEILVAVEVTDLDEMLGNLIENSYKWAKSLIRVHATKDDEQLRLVIEDDGKGVDSSEINEIVKRGVRLDESTPGSGLGLNIVVEMAYSYRGQLSFDKSKMGGLKVSLLLPLSR